MTAWCLQGQMVSVDMTRQLQAMGGGGGGVQKTRVALCRRQDTVGNKRGYFWGGGWWSDCSVVRSRRAGCGVWMRQMISFINTSHRENNMDPGVGVLAVAGFFFFFPETSTPFQDDFCFHCAWLSCRKGLLLKALGSLKNQRPMSDILLRNLNSLIIFSPSYFFLNHINLLRAWNGWGW